METLIKEVLIGGKSKYAGRPSGWSIWNIDGVRTYRNDWWRKGRDGVKKLFARVEMHFTDEGIVRKQIKGNLPFVWRSREQTIEKGQGNIFMAYQAMLLAFEDGIYKTIGNRHNGWMVIANNPTLRQKWAKYFPGS